MTPAILALQRAQVAFTVHEYLHDPAFGGYGEEAAARLGIAPGRVYKTLVAQSAPARLLVAVVSVDRMLDLKRLAAAAGARRVAMAEPRSVERSTGYVLGGVSPIGQKRALPTWVDASLSDHPTVFVSAGRRGLEVEIAPADLIWVTRAGIAPLAR